jgi:glycosyltransferase involved in cell wall biosynthesis
VIRTVIIGHTYIVAANRGKVRWLAKNPDLDVSAIAPDSWNETDFGRRDFTPDDQISFHTFVVTNSGNVRKYLYPWRALFFALKKLRPDVVQLEAEAGSFVSIQVALMRALLKFKLVLFVWDNLKDNRTTALKAARFVYARTDRLIAGSAPALAVAQAQGYKGQADVYPQIGIDPLWGKNQEPVALPNERAGFCVGYVGRLDAKKGVDVLIDAASRIPGIHVTIVGEGDARGGLEQQIDLLKLADRVTLVGAVGHDRVAGYMKTFDALVLPSVDTPGWSEQFGHVLIEAMALSIPVIGSRAGAIPDVIADAGLLFAPGDADALAAAILDLVDAPARAKQIGKAGNAHMHRLYTDRAIAEQTHATWKKAVQS